ILKRRSLNGKGSTQRNVLKRSKRQKHAQANTKLYKNKRKYEQSELSEHRQAYESTDKQTRAQTNRREHRQINDNTSKQMGKQTDRQTNKQEANKEEGKQMGKTNAAKSFQTCLVYHD
ncbi:hypothetical protein POVCU1_082130, partial [Plasmodium ovale curtisi]